jgi:GntR family transcriptional repressor for pyruvate dehydrogenase complex
MFLPVRRQGATDAVFEQMAGQIVSGDLAPGVTLPAERELAMQLSVSRPALREALQRLAQVGLIRIRQGGGTRVLDWATGAGLDLLPRLLFRDDGTLNADVVRSIFEMREVVGADAASLCAIRASDGQVQAIQSAAAGLSDDDTVTDLAQAALELWNLLITGSGNVVYRMAFNSMNAAYQPALPVMAQILSEELRDTQAHRALANAVAQRDPASAKAAAHYVLRRSAQQREDALAAISQAQKEGK